ncbi:MAG: hypothetical protein COA85_00555 [Robiginitomaculum sp.]|nr:MAG: hypothetical protein COA85_00555 [Robiginitomaculum sp.]
MLVQWFSDRNILERILAVNLTIILLMSALGLVTLHHFNQVVEIGESIEAHPLVVGNAVLEIEVSVSALNSYLKTVLENKDQDSIAAYQHKVNELDPAILINFLTIEDRFLGDPKMARGASFYYLDWKRHNARMMQEISSNAKAEIVERTSRESWLSRDLMSDYLTEIDLFAHTKARSFIQGLQGQRRAAVTWAVLFVLVAATLAIILSVLVGRTVARPIRLLQRVMNALAKGDLDVNLPEVHSDRFEAGAIAKAAQSLKASAKEKNRLVEKAEQARAKAEKANQAKSQFLAMMSHELRTPMNAILGSAQVLDSMELDAEVREHVDTLSTGGETLMAVLNDVLDLTKIESGKLSVEHTDFDFITLLKQAQSLWAPRASDKALELNFHIDDDVPHWINSDTTRIRQILFNLLSNAIKFTNTGSVDVSVKQGGMKNGKVQLEIAVHDTGIGIAADSMDVLFNPFEQADSSITRRFGGTGLGLSISRQLATLLGGELNVVSDEGKGSTFTLQFCAEPCKAARKKRASHTDIIKKPLALSILVAEDNAMNIKVLRALLKPFPYEIVHAENGEIALDFLNHRQFDLILMDIQMPVLDGMEATLQLRASDSPNKDTPVIAMTANAMEGDRENYLAAGMTGYVPKPIDARQLYTTIAQAAAQGHKGKKNTPKRATALRA